MPQHLTDMQITRVSAVDKGANRKHFAIFKRAGTGAEEVAMPDQVTATPATNETPEGFAGWLRKAADFIVGRPVAKTETFASLVAGQELTDALYDSFGTLESALWSAIYAYSADGTELSIPDKQALVAQSLDEFKSYLLDAMASGIAKRDVDDVAIATGRITALVEKAGAKVSAARLERLRTAAEALNSVLAEVDQDTTEKRADAQEDAMTPEELTAAIAKGIEPLASRIEALEKEAPAPPAAPPAGDPVVKDDEPATLDDVAGLVVKLADRVEAIEKARGERTSADGQDAGAVKKSRWAGIF